MQSSLIDVVTAILFIAALFMAVVPFIAEIGQARAWRGAIRGVGLYVGFLGCIAALCMFLNAIH